MTAPRQEQQGRDQRQKGNGTDEVLPVVPVVPLPSLDEYVAYRTLLHSRDQETIAADLALSLYPLWQIQDFNDLDRTTPLWMASAVPQVKTAYLQSQRMMAVYANDLRMATAPEAGLLPMAIPDVELPRNVRPMHFDTSLIPHIAPDPERQPLVTFDDFPLTDVATSLVINGNYGIKANMPGPEDELMYSGLSNSTGAAVRQAMNGGRNVTKNLVQFDRKVIGYARYTDANPCAWCALLASRGAVYGKGSFINANAKFKPNPNGAKDLPADYIPARTHNHCRCVLRPVYAKAHAMDDDAKFYRDQWKRVTREWYWLNNAQQIEKFREQYKPFERPTPNITDIKQELLDRAEALSDAGFDRFSPQVEWTDRQLNQLA